VLSTAHMLYQPKYTMLVFLFNVLSRHTKLSPQQFVEVLRACSFFSTLLLTRGSIHAIQGAS
jgi:hypothetical protein